MKHLYSIFVIIIIGILSAPITTAKILEGNVSLIENVPQDFYGTWIVTGTMLSASITDVYKPYSVDVWTLSRYGNIIVLANPISGASASISVEEINGNTIKFNRVSTSDNQTSIEVPEITLNGNFFEGIDNMVIEHFLDNHKSRKDILKYKIEGKKVASERLF